MGDDQLETTRTATEKALTEHFKKRIDNAVSAAEATKSAEGVCASHGATIELGLVTVEMEEMNHAQLTDHRKLLEKIAHNTNGGKVIPISIGPMKIPIPQKWVFYAACILGWMMWQLVMQGRMGEAIKVIEEVRELRAAIISQPLSTNSFARVVHE